MEIEFKSGWKAMEVGVASGRTRTQGQRALDTNTNPLTWLVHEGVRAKAGWWAPSQGACVTVPVLACSSLE